MAEEPPLRVLVVDDEPLGRARVRELLDEAGDVELVGEAEDGDAAVERIRELGPDLVFLDVRMPGMTGVEVVERIGPESMPFTVFVTAHEEFALDAFELDAVDYLVKPFSDERFEESLERARRRVDRGGSPDGDGPDYLKRIAVRERGELRVVPVEEIDHISASGVYVVLHASDGRHLLRSSLTALEERLDPEMFVRIHRSEIVRLDRVEALVREDGGSYEVELRSGERLSVGRTRKDELEKRLGRL